MTKDKSVLNEDSERERERERERKRKRERERVEGGRSRKNGAS